MALVLPPERKTGLGHSDIHRVVAHTTQEEAILLPLSAGNSLEEAVTHIFMEVLGQNQLRSDSMIPVNSKRNRVGTSIQQVSEIIPDFSSSNKRTCGQEAEVGGSLEVKSTRLAWTTCRNPVSTKHTKISQLRWPVPVIPATWEAEAGELLEPRRQRLQEPRSHHYIPAWTTETHVLGVTGKVLVVAAIFGGLVTRQQALVPRLEDTTQPHGARGHEERTSDWTALWEAEAGRSQGQEIETNLTSETLSMLKIQKISRAWIMQTGLTAQLCEYTINH
ncbi:hypothetical protein AAY473_032917 [Plecturocebus cupreus]